MNNFKSLLLALAIFSLPGESLAKPKCRVLPADSKWPAASVWQNFNFSISGQLIAVQPVAISCYPGPLFNNDTCTDVNANWAKCAWQADRPNGMCINSGELTCPPIQPPAKAGQTCTIGNSAVYAVNATSAQQVAAGLKFAKMHNIRVIVKTTGHDFLRRSTGFGSLEIWMRHLRTGIEYQKTVKSASNCQKNNWSGGAMRVGGGYQWGDAYAVAEANNVVIMGGGVRSIGVTGGWMQSGGYGPGTHFYGMGVDQVLEAEVVLANGNTVIVNSCQNTDIYTAIRGGGPATYGVVTSATLKVHPNSPFVANRLSIPYPPEARETYLELVAKLYESHSAVIEAGFGLAAFWGQAHGSVGKYAPPGYFQNAYTLNSTIEAAKAVYAPVEKMISASGLNYSITWSTYGDYWALFRGVSGGGDPGVPLGVNYSRFMDRTALTSNGTALRGMIKVLAGAPEDDVIESILCMSGGQVHKNANLPFIGVLPAWRTSYCLQLSQRIWADNADAASIAAYKQDVLYVKGAAMKALAPSTGTYMNEGNREDPDWKVNFYGINYEMLRKIKKRHDPASLFFCPTCVGSDEWTLSDAGKLCKV